MVKTKNYNSRDDEFYASGSLFGEEWGAEIVRMRNDAHDERYTHHRKRAAERSRKKSEDGREIGPLPECADPQAVEACRMDLLRFMQTFGAEEFPDPFSDAQLYAIRAVQETLLSGGSRPLCLPRGYGKTTICEWGMLWAIAYGHQKFILLIAAKTKLAERILDNIYYRIKTLEHFAACFPALCYPIECLENSPGRAPGQTLDGRHTDIKMNTELFISPTVQGAPSSHIIVTTSGLEGAIRGLKIGTFRPTAILIDDPQTDKSARSRTQTDNRWNLLTGCINGLAGPKTVLAVIAAITVITEDDLSERILEHWGGRRFSMLRSLPKNMELWEEYAKLLEIGRRNHIRSEDIVQDANRFYLSRRAEMDEGAEAEWETNFTGLEHSAIQHGMNLYFANRLTFFSEYQNRPITEADQTANLKLPEILRKITSVPRYTLPEDCFRVTCGIDIQQDCLYWVTAAWGEGFRGHVMDYGRFPSGQKTIQDLFPAAGEKDAFYLALRTLCPILEGRQYPDSHGNLRTVTKGFIDANRGLFTPQVRRACFDATFEKAHPDGNAGQSLTQKVKWFSDRLEAGIPYELETVWEPVFGWGKGADASFIRGGLKIGEQRGEGWQRLPWNPENLVRHTRYDTNLWKSNIRTFLQASPEALATLTIFEGDEVSHYQFCQHLLAERSEIHTGPRGTIDKWRLIPGRENHMFDCLVMAAVANASIGGRTISGTGPAQSDEITFSADWDDWD